MKNEYYQGPRFPGGATPYGTPNQQMAPTEATVTGLPLVEEQSYIENILRLNIGKKGRFYFSFPDSVEWRDKIFTGILEKSGRDHLIISDPNSGNWYLLLMIYLDYIEFEEPIDFEISQPLPGNI